jgi:3'-phosphoadenosine 5'-phosphosulfate sulfotransferase (PAPS reductase)/FAD synthetase
MSETLDFVHACQLSWDCLITWLEYADHDNPQKRWKQVNYDTASRNGEPFAAVIGRTKLLPNPVMRICTSGMKIQSMKLFAQQVLGFQHWDVVIGYRADEPRRVSKLTNPNHQPYDRIAPLARGGVTALDVMRFWQTQPFDLQLPNMSGKTIHGNCDLCFMKGGAQVFSLIRENPQRAIWWIEQENRISKAGGLTYLFRSDRPSYADMFHMANNQEELFGFNDSPSIMDCACTD